MTGERPADRLEGVDRGPVRIEDDHIFPAVHWTAELARINDVFTQFLAERESAFYLCLMFINVFFAQYIIEIKTLIPQNQVIAFKDNHLQRMGQRMG